jgi:energy-coupling factor transporter transmembrane protein EcfT
MTEKNKNKNINENSKYWQLELFALVGFCISGIVFILSGIKNKDFLTILGSAVWIASCLVWMITYKKYFDNSDPD